MTGLRDEDGIKIKIHHEGHEEREEREFLTGLRDEDGIKEELTANKREWEMEKFGFHGIIFQVK